eukprot:1181904-Prorocentrum_minimum.AAC.7
MHAQRVKGPSFYQGHSRYRRVVEYIDVSRCTSIRVEWHTHGVQRIPIGHFANYGHKWFEVQKTSSNAQRFRNIACACVEVHHTHRRCPDDGAL